MDIQPMVVIKASTRCSSRKDGGLYLFEMIKGEWRL